MKTKSLLSTVLLILVWTVSYSQLILTRQQKESIVTDLIKGKACDTLLTIRTAQLKAEGEKAMEMGGVRIELEKKIDVFEDTIIPGWVGKEKEWVAKEVIYKGEVRKYKLRWIITGAVAVVVITLESMALVNSLR